MLTRHVPLYWVVLAALSVALAGWLVRPSAGQAPAAAPPAPPPQPAAAAPNRYQVAGMDREHFVVVDTRTGQAWTYSSAALNWSNVGTPPGAKAD